jgi:hypothetical protein
MSQKLTLASLLAVSLALPALASAQDLPAPELASERLEQIFERQAGHGEFGRYLWGITGVTLGAGGVGTGLWLLFDEGVFDNSDHQLLTGGILLGMGAMTLANNIYALATPSFGAQRYERFRLAAADGLSEREIGAFEGELRLDAERGRLGRQLHLYTGIGKIVGGAALAIATGASGDVQGEAADWSYAISGILGGMGVLMIVKSLVCRSPAERVWESYLREETPAELGGVDVDVAPMASPGGAGLGVAGTF